MPIERERSYKHMKGREHLRLAILVIGRSVNHCIHHCIHGYIRHLSASRAARRILAVASNTALANESRTLRTLLQVLETPVDSGHTG
jgi:hypothetical protein